MSRLVRCALTVLALGAFTFIGAQAAAAETDSASIASCQYPKRGCES